MALRFGSLFSGIEAASVAWLPLGWQCSWVAEIDPFACAVLAHHYPDIPNLGDVNRINPNAVEPVDLVVFGSPCQSFSVAGKRLGLDDPRGNLALVALRLIGRIRPKWVVFENVPGLLSSDGGRDFGAFLGLLGECGYGFAYRILDAQFTGVPQRRRRVFVVGYLGDWRPPAAVLFEPESLRGDSAPRREAGQRIACPIASSPESDSGYRNDADIADNLIAFAHQQGGNIDLHTATDCALTVQRNQGQSDALPLRAQSQASHRADSDTYIAHCLNAKGGGGRIDGESETFVTVIGQNGSDIQIGDGESIGALSTSQRPGHGDTIVTHTLSADGFDAGEDGSGRGTPLTLAIRGRGDSHDLEYRDDGVANAILTPNGGRGGIGVGAVALPMSVRRLTPRECARLQGFPDDYLDILYRGKPAADGNKYRALGNSMAVPVVRWIGHRIQLFEAEAAPSLAGDCAA